jgi:CCR4-NOT transcription complex subunit 6
MYYPQQSPGIAHKLPTHHDQSPWGRSHVLGPPGAQGVPPPPSPGYAMYTNGAHSSMQPISAHHPHQLAGHPPPLSHHHHHHNSITHYSSPPNGQPHQQHVVGQGSPGQANSQLMTPHWQQQLLKCDVRYPRIFLIPFDMFTFCEDDPFLTISSSSCPS